MNFPSNERVISHRCIESALNLDDILEGQHSCNETPLS